MADVLILIPARMASTRLPGKPLADIAGEPMIVHVMRRAQDAGVGPVVVATDSPAIAAAVEKAAGRAVMTAADHASGSDRIFEALGKVDPRRDAGIVVNVQGDLPTLDPAAITAAIEVLADPAVDIATLAAEIRRARPPARALFHARHCALRRGAALPSHRPLRLSPSRARTVYRLAAVAARAAREARTIARARSRYADRRRHHRYGAARRRYA